MKVERNQKQGLYIISVAASLADVHPQTLRTYERKGLLCPERTPKNRRRYSDSDILRLRRIQELTQSEGLNLSGVRKVLEMEDEMNSLREQVMRLEREMVETRNRMLQDIRDVKRRVALSRMPPVSLVSKRKTARD